MTDDMRSDSPLDTDHEENLPNGPIEDLGEARVRADEAAAKAQFESAKAAQADIHRLNTMSGKQGR